MSNTKFRIGTQVQFFVNRKVRDGEVVAVSTPLSHRPENFWSLPEEERNKYQTMVSILPAEDPKDLIVLEASRIQLRDDEFQRAYRLACETAQELIYAKCAEADSALSEAVELSEKYGIPFSPSISFLGQSYVPESMTDMYPEVDREFMCEVAEAYNDDVGWQHSAVCF